jgi:peptidoglycan-N-acetylglucosamine deacetylase
MVFLTIKGSKLRKGFTAIIILLIFSLFVTVMKIGNVSVFSNNKRRLPIYYVDTTEKRVAITFDASWGKDNTDEILTVLDKYDVKATFFVLGAWVDDHPDKLKEIFDRGHEIGNHTDRHPDMNTITKEKLINEIKITDEKIKRITGKATFLFRCPSGDYNDMIIETVESTKHFCIQWNVDSIDWKGEGADIEYNRVIKRTVPGSILLFHNEAIHTPQNLPRIIEYLQKKGYTFVTVSDLIYKENYYIDNTGKQILNKSN